MSRHFKCLFLIFTYLSFLFRFLLMCRFGAYVFVLSSFTCVSLLFPFLRMSPFWFPFYICVSSGCSFLLWIPFGCLLTYVSLPFPLLCMCSLVSGFTQVSPLLPLLRVSLHVPFLRMSLISLKCHT